MQRQTVILYLLLYSCRSAVDLNLCENYFDGSPCTMTCIVPNFDNDIEFYDSPQNSVGICLKDSPTCKSLSDGSIFRGIDSHVYYSIGRLNKQIHNGSWTCSYGVQESEPKLLQVYERPAELKITYLSVKEGESVNLFCDIDVSSQSYNSSWYFEGQKVIDNEKYVNTAISNLSSLIIQNITEKDKGLYQCKLTVPAKSTYTQKGSLISIVSVRQPIKKEKPAKLNVIYLTFDEGESAKLLCDIDVSGQRYNSSWYFKGQKISDNEKYGIIANSSEFSLNIQRITQNDKGMYHCEVTIPTKSTLTQKGSIISIASVRKTTNEERTRRTQPTSYISATEGSRITLLCDLNIRNESNRVIWFFNDIKLTKSDRTKFSHASLTLDPVSYLDNGIYHCTMTLPEDLANKQYGPFISVAIAKHVENTNCGQSPNGWMAALMFVLGSLTGAFVMYVIIIRYGFKCSRKARKGNTQEIDDQGIEDTAMNPMDNEHDQ